jgi:hypothetical protein
MPYPPIPLAAWSFTSLGTYFGGIGLYFSAVLISRDANLRKSMNQMIADKDQFFANIGYSEMEKDVGDRVHKLVKEQEEKLKEQSGVQQSVPEEQVQQYIDEVMQEVKKLRKD